MIFNRSAATARKLQESSSQWYWAASPIGLHCFDRIWWIDLGLKEQDLQAVALDWPWGRMIGRSWCYCLPRFGAEMAWIEIREQGLSSTSTCICWGHECYVLLQDRKEGEASKKKGSRSCTWFGSEEEYAYEYSFWVNQWVSGWCSFLGQPILKFCLLG